ncbi:MAG: YHS domain-containing (seleno)protein [Cytophagales bacterium]|nr:YHS domain-containing (seleno)protein [Cytophagales bacterium]
MKSLFTFLLLICSSIVVAQEAYPVENGEVLLDGYDPVSYFLGEAKKGSSDILIEIDGRHLLFSSEENKKTYEQSPEKFEPAYGGWCAIAMVDKTFVVPDYTLYKIQDGALMFFSIRAFFNGLTEWDKDPDKNKLLADTNYTVLFD